MDNYIEDVAEAIDLLASAWRGSWSDFDGRTLRAQLSDLSYVLRHGGEARNGEPFDVDHYCLTVGICRECRSWDDCWTHTPHKEP